MVMHVNVAPVGAASQSEKVDLRTRGGQLSIQDLLNNLDVDGDGDVDEEDRKIGDTLKQMDMDGDGMISIKELVNIGKIKVQDDKKISNMRKYMVVGGIISLLFIALSLCATIAAIELTKESRNKDSVMTDSSSGKAVATAPLTGGVNPTTGKKDTAVKDSDGNVATSGVAKGSTVLSSRTLTVETAKAITDLTLPVKVDGKSLTVSVTVTGFELAPDGSKCMFYTASGGLVLVVDEDITVYKKSVTGEMRTMKVDPARPATRRAAARRLAKYRRSRSLLQYQDYGMYDYSDYNGTYYDPFYDPSMYEGMNDECPPGAACGSGDCTGSVCSPPWCDYGMEWNEATGTCECPPDTSLQADNYGWQHCKCDNGMAEIWYSDSNYISHRVCLPCPGGSVSNDGYSCHSCDPANGVERIWQYGDYYHVPGGTSDYDPNAPPTEAGYCMACPPGQHKEVESMDGDMGYIWERCECDNPCMVLEWDMTDEKMVCKTCTEGMNAVHSEHGYRWCSSMVYPEWGEYWCYDSPDGDGTPTPESCAPPMTLDPVTGVCIAPDSTHCVAPMVWDTMTLTCKAPENTLTCVAPMFFDPATNSCMYPETNCEHPMTYDPMMMACVTPVTCMAPMVYDPVTQVCVATDVTCTPPMVIDTLTNTCVTPSTICMPPMVYDPQILACITPMTTVTCDPPLMYNSATGACEDAMLTCEGQMVYDAATQSCVDCPYPMYFDTVMMMCMSPDPHASCMYPLEYDEATGTCIDPYNHYGGCCNTACYRK